MCRYGAVRDAVIAVRKSFVYYEGDEIDAELWEIAENLHRAELTTLERNEQVARWIELLSEQRISAQPAPKIEERGRGRRESGIRAASRDLGIDRDDASRAVKVASLSDEAKQAARELKLDNNRSALLSAARQQGIRQASRIDTEMLHRWLSFFSGANG